MLDGFDLALCGKQWSHPPVSKLLDGEQEAQVIASRLGPPPRGCGSWSLRLLARQVFELGSISIWYETGRQTLMEGRYAPQVAVLGEPPKRMPSSPLVLGRPWRLTSLPTVRCDQWSAWMCSGRN